ncbi:acyl carrier protein [Actinocrispum sp. NPDC049592]|uniref:acyl carrier protein n=1 Tax=Actinocrispum sp. NPDC049592 TaxID=3154835 RepID=UPI003424D1C2
MTEQITYSPVQIRDIVLKLYQQVLGNSDICGQDDFFDHGGDSEKGVIVLHTLRDLTGARIAMSTMYMCPSADELSEEVASALAR